MLKDLINIFIRWVWFKLHPSFNPLTDETRLYAKKFTCELWGTMNNLKSDPAEIRDRMYGLTSQPRIEYDQSQHVRTTVPAPWWGNGGYNLVIIFEISPDPYPLCAWFEKKEV